MKFRSYLLIHIIGTTPMSKAKIYKNESNAMLETFSKEVLLAENWYPATGFWYLAKEYLRGTDSKPSVVQV